MVSGYEIALFRTILAPIIINGTSAGLILYKIGSSELENCISPVKLAISSVAEDSETAKPITADSTMLPK